ncbi:unnamed protein product [Parajaminaea phylloscopi]
MPSAFKRGPRTLTPAAASRPDTSSSQGPSTSRDQSQVGSPPAVTADAATAVQSPSDGPKAQARTSTPSVAYLRPAVHPTLRPSPFPQQLPLPLFSLGLHAINDVLTGTGLPAGCLAVNLPLDDGQHDRWRLEAAQAYADLATRYAAAQGIAAGQNVLVIAEQADDWVESLMGWAGQDEVVPSSANGADGKSATSAVPAAATAPSAASTSSDPEQLKSAFRYEKMKRLQEFASDGLTDKEDESRSTPFVHPFDLSTKISRQVVKAAISQGRLVVHSLGFDGDGDNDAASGNGGSYQRAWDLIEATTQRWAQQTASAGQEPSHSSSTASRTPPSAMPCRILLPSLGSPAWSTWRPSSSTAHARECYRLLLRVKTLVRALSWPATSAERNDSSKSPVEMPTIAVCSPAASLLLSSPNLDTKLATLADGALAFGSFAADPRLRSIFGGVDESREGTSSSSSSSSTSAAAKAATFTGPLRVIQTPTLGSLKPPSIRASQLRGLSSSQSGASGAGSENSLGFKVRRKGIKVDVIGRDLVAGGAPSEGDNKSGPAPPPLPPPPPLPAPRESSGQVSSLDGSAAASTHASESPGAQRMEKERSEAPPSPQRGPPLKGLAALRARGLQAHQTQTQAQAQTQQPQRASRDEERGLDIRSHRSADEAEQRQEAKQRTEWQKREALAKAAQEDW